MNALSSSKKRTLLASLDELTQRMPSLLDIDHPCAQRQIADARRMVEVCTMQSQHLGRRLYLKLTVN